ncbi:hypothetical protein HaLaN_02416 [Haematococcus lacustris]|uniref:Uncharacterized protein n=1 Tax=Haematococcus lacustris TaxID=44745 RepID=A0A699YL51_HAELA|nr:hypothetical protein HaLaN_02416 [Haematococcus lacustris]
MKGWGLGGVQPGGLGWARVMPKGSDGKLTGCRNGGKGGWSGRLSGRVMGKSPETAAAKVHSIKGCHAN